jgi:hypothetical protein
MSGMEKRAELVVLAQLDGSSPSLGKKKFVFATIKTFKGTVGERVVVWTPKFEVSCGLRVRRDVAYVLFVYREDGKPTVDHCSSWPLTREYSHFTAAFNEFYGLTGTEALEPGSNVQRSHDTPTSFEPEAGFNEHRGRARRNRECAGAALELRGAHHRIL